MYTVDTTIPVILPETGFKYLVTGNWEPPKFLVLKAEIDGIDVTKYVRDTPVWNMLATGAATACGEREQEYAEYLKDLRDEDES